MNKRKWSAYLLALLMLCMTLFSGCGSVDEELVQQVGSAVAQEVVNQLVQQAESEEYYEEDEEGSYTEGNTAYVDVYTIDEDGWYSAPEEVALYIHTYGELPDNFITKKEAQMLGWDNKKGNLWEVADGMSIGGDRFGNKEGILPEEDRYTECDVNYTGGYRGSERIVFSDDGDIYYTEDHYETFEQLY